MVRVRETPIEKIHGAAAIFAFVSRDLNTLAGYFDVSDRTIRRWANLPQFQNALDVFGYTGDRAFEVQPFRDTEREQGQTYRDARDAYIQAMLDGEPQHRWATLAGNAVGLPRQRIHVWAIKHGWRDAIQKP